MPAALSDRSVNRPRPLSSQTRKWGDELDAVLAQPDPDDDDLFVLNSQDWPPTPPKKNRAPPSPPKRAQATRESFTGSVSSHVATTSGRSTNSASTSQQGRPYLASASFSKPGTSSSSSQSRFAKPGSQDPKVTKPLAPMFRAPSSSHPSNTTIIPQDMSSGSTSNTKKRVLPWENLQDGSRVSSSRSNFHNLGTGVGGSGGMSDKVKSAMLTSDTMNIKQKVILSPEQQMVLKLAVDDGKNVFFTGSAGTGKSVLLREIITSLKNKYANRSDAVAVTASTGMAACNIGGVTIHSFSGIGLGKEDAAFLIGKIKKNKIAAGKWARTQVWVIDEVSMVDGILFDKLAAIACALKKKPGRFGGIQLIVTGDFFQLPPVANGMATFAFEAKAWKDIDYTVNLTQVFRQKSTEFIDMLNEMRFGTMSASSIAKFRALHRPLSDEDGVDATELFPRREDVEKANQTRLAALGGDASTFVADDWPAPEPGRTNTYHQNFMAPQKLVLKIGAQVMLIKNLDSVLVNGTVGKVVGFGQLDEDDDEEGEGEDYEDKRRKKIKLAEEVGLGRAELAPVVEWRTPLGIERTAVKREEFKVEDPQGKKIAHRRQFPLILAWAMSIHKSQGQTIPRVKVDLRRIFEKGQSYVALSRATSLEGLQVMNFDPKKVEAHPKVVAWSKTLKVLS